MKDHPDPFVAYWLNAIERGEDMDYGALAELTHDRQVAIFNYCTCEDPSSGHRAYDDCPPWTVEVTA